MTSAGEPAMDQRIAGYLMGLRGFLAGGIELDAALGMIPAEDREAVRIAWLAQRIQVEEIGVLAKREPGTWLKECDPAQGYHWRRLRDFLMLEKNRSDSVVNDLDDSTDKILSRLEDPRPGGPQDFTVKGLVVGHVQSGKTANFSALIAKAVDAGYSIIIVLSGLHNSLRRQTQLRLEDELGLVDAKPGRPAVGTADPDHTIIPLTTADVRGDFQRQASDRGLLRGGGRLILVVKKNASVLRRLVEWLEERQPVIKPVLVIDDEADQASINTGGNRSGPDLADLVDLSDDDVDGGTASPTAQQTETDPSVINALLRRLLLRLRRVAYVGYTATPFANVLIDRKARDRDVGADLYPDDFIISLRRPAVGYVGTEDLFGRAALAGEDDGKAPLDVIRRVPDHEADQLNPGRRAPGGHTVPPSLREALLDFYLALAAHDTRTGGRPAASMLIHASAYTDQQLALGDGVQETLDSIRQQWRYDLQRYRPLLRTRWEQHFRPVSASMDPARVLDFDDIEAALARNFRERMPVLVLNTKTDDELDYEQRPDLRAVVVGGNKLSRGLTIEGLLVSYYVRPAGYFDTLLQMGRWFGYRQAYADLTRLYTTEDLRLRFRDLATAEEALRREIRYYDLQGKKPTDFAPRIMAHATMQITAPNRMGSAREVSANYSGALVQTTLFHLRRRDWLDANLEAVRGFLASLGEPNAVGRDKMPAWRDVDWHAVTSLLTNYQTFSERSRFSSSLLREYIHEQASRHRELICWRVSVRGRQTTNPRLGTEDLAITGWGRVACINRAREAESENSIGTLINPASRAGGGDEEIGLDPAIVQQARGYSRKHSVSYPVTLRQQRPVEEGLLLVYPIGRHSQQERGQGRNLFDNVERDGQTVIGLAAVLPYSESQATVRWVTGGWEGNERATADT